MRSVFRTPRLFLCAAAGTTLRHKLRDGIPANQKGSPESVCTVPSRARKRAGAKTREEESMQYQTRFGSLDKFQKGTIEIINDKAKHYVFSNVFEVASKAKPYEKSWSARICNT